MYLFYTDDAGITATLFSVILQKRDIKQLQLLLSIRRRLLIVNQETSADRSYIINQRFH
jgi:hypothetical protein